MGLFNAIKRTGRVIQCLPALPFVLKPVNRQAPYSELSRQSYSGVWQWLRAGRTALLPDYDPFRPTPRLPRAYPRRKVQSTGQKWFFINGICTSSQVLALNGKALAELFDREITLLHNPSDGLVLDLLECAIGRTMQIVSNLDQGIADILREALSDNEKIVLIAHSQGGIIATKALYLLRKQLIQDGQQARLKRLEYYSFASAATEFDMPEVYSEHFFHASDFVAQIGVAGYQQAYTGKLFKVEGSGHLINCHYLPALREGRYRSTGGAASRLFGYVPKVSVRRVGPRQRRTVRSAQAS